MKNLQKLLLAAAFATIMSSTKTMATFNFYNTYQEFPDKSTETPTTEERLEESTPSTPMTTTPTENIMATIAANKNVLMDIAATLGSFGIIAGAQGCYALKKVNNYLNKAGKRTFETSVQLDKGIKNNKRIMLASLIAIVSPFAIEKLSQKTA